MHIGNSVFTIVSIEPGKEHKFGDDKTFTLRMCSVASGRFGVTLGKLGFDIGVGGMWRIKSREYCAVKNVGKDVAVLHVTSMP